jgi:hypothetical protein
VAGAFQALLMKPPKKTPQLRDSLSTSTPALSLLLFVPDAFNNKMLNAFFLLSNPIRKKFRKVIHTLSRKFVGGSSGVL